MKAPGVFLAVCFAGGAILQAQTAPAIPVALNQTQTFGMLGVASNQTARLNVLNSTAPPMVAGSAVQSCTLTLQFFDEQNNKLAELAVPGLDPGKASHLDYSIPTATATTAPTPQRMQVRGVVVVSGVPMPQPTMPTIQAISPCSVLPTLEVFDNDTGKTQVVLTGPTSIPIGIVPLM
jgi:hypothetical protein